MSDKSGRYKDRTWDLNSSDGNIAWDRVHVAAHPTRPNVRICRGCAREKTARYRARRKS